MSDVLRCQVCFALEDEHAEKQHKFSLDGQLHPKEAPKEPRVQVQELNAAHLVVRLLAILRERGVISEADLLEVLGARTRSAPPHGAGAGRGGASGDAEGSLRIDLGGS